MSLTAINNPKSGIASDPRMAIVESKQSNPLNYSPNFSLEQYQLDAVATDAVATWICPEVYSERMCDQYQIDASAITRGELRIPVVTDANGNVGIYINPHAWYGESGTAASWFALSTVNNGTTPFNPTTGGYVTTYTTGYTTYASVFYNSNNVLSDAMGVGFSVRFVPVVSDLNNGGFVEYAQFKTVVNSSFSSQTPSVSTAQVQNNPYYTFTNLKTEQRHIWIPTDNTDFQYTAYNSNAAVGQSGTPFNDMFYFVFQGCNASSTVGEIIVTDVRQYHPNANYTQYIQSVQAQPGPATRQLVAALIKSCPTLECLTLSEAKKFTETMRSCEPRFSCLLKVAMDNIIGTNITYSPVDQKDYQLLKNIRDNQAPGLNGTNNLLGLGVSG